MARDIPVTQARAELADLVNTVGYAGERILLTKHGKPLAALVPVSDLEALEAQEAQQRRMAEIGFTIATEPSAPAPERPAGPMRIAAEHREPRRPR